MSTPFKLKGWSPFTQKTAPVPFPGETEMPTLSSTKSGKQEFEGYTYDEDTKLYMDNETGETFTGDELKSFTSIPSK